MKRRILPIVHWRGLVSQSASTVSVGMMYLTMLPNTRRPSSTPCSSTARPDCFRLLVFTACYLPGLAALLLNSETNHRHGMSLGTLHLRIRVPELGMGFFRDQHRRASYGGDSDHSCRELGRRLLERPTAPNGFKKILLAAFEGHLKALNVPSCPRSGGSVRAVYVQWKGRYGPFPPAPARSRKTGENVATPSASEGKRGYATRNETRGRRGSNPQPSDRQSDTLAN